MAIASLRNVYQFKITLKGAKPPIWRRVLVPSDMTLEQFHLVIQITMGWLDCHLHQFTIEGIEYGTMDDEFDLGIEDESQYKIQKLINYENQEILYEYDFGDGWDHKIVLEKILAYDNQVLPVCIKGKRACPPEDCGGIWGYKNLVDIISDKNHPEREDMLEWLGGEFEPENFNLEEINEVLNQYDLF